jgi:protein-S-isoprenylcysteine O-methyltransferase Ste14
MGGQQAPAAPGRGEHRPQGHPAERHRCSIHPKAGTQRARRGVWNYPPYPIGVPRGDIGALILAIQELSIVLLVLTRRRAHVAVAADSPPAVLAWCGTILPLLLRPPALAPVPLAVLGNAIQLAGGLIVLAATLRLGRSFGIVAANRGIQTDGLYRVVRHPIYAAYGLAFRGFVLAHPTLINGGILVVWLMVQVLRIRAEERLLMQDTRYAAYAAQVRYRLIPGWW